jgi:hypothetical protein
MRDKDSQLIFENYEKNVLLNEAYGQLLMLLIPPALAFVSGQLKWTSGTLNWIKEKTNGYIDIQAFLEYPEVDFVTNIVDATGLTYWPKLEKSMDAFKLDPSPENFADVTFNLFGTFPVIGRLRGIFVAIKEGKTVLKEAPIIYKFLAWVLQKVTDNIFKKPEFIKILKKTFTSSPKEVQQRIIAIFTVLGTKSILQVLGSETAEGAAENVNKNRPYTTEDGIAILPKGKNAAPSPSPTPSPSPSPSPTPYDF